MTSQTYESVLRGATASREGHLWQAGNTYDVFSVKSASPSHSCAAYGERETCLRETVAGVVRTLTRLVSLLRVHTFIEKEENHLHYRMSSAFRFVVLTRSLASWGGRTCGFLFFTIFHRLRVVRPGQGYRTFKKKKKIICFFFMVRLNTYCVLQCHSRFRVASARQKCLAHGPTYRPHRFVRDSTRRGIT